MVPARTWSHNRMVHRSPRRSHKLRSIGCEQVVDPMFWRGPYYITRFTGVRSSSRFASQMCLRTSVRVFASLSFVVSFLILYFKWCSSLLPGTPKFTMLYEAFWTSTCVLMLCHVCTIVYERTKLILGSMCAEKLSHVKRFQRVWLQNLMFGRWNRALAEIFLFWTFVNWLLLPLLLHEKSSSRFAGSSVCSTKNCHLFPDRDIM